jgi:hypothetical protein
MRSGRTDLLRLRLSCWLDLDLMSPLYSVDPGMWVRQCTNAGVLEGRRVENVAEESHASAEIVPTLCGDT